MIYVYLSYKHVRYKNVKMLKSILRYVSKL